MPRLRVGACPNARIEQRTGTRTTTSSATATHTPTAHPVRQVTISALMIRPDSSLPHAGRIAALTGATGFAAGDRKEHIHETNGNDGRRAGGDDSGRF